MNDQVHILVVEDDDVLRDAVCLTLELGGYQVSGVNGGPAALDALNAKVFQLVLTDLRMQPMDGLQLLTEIRHRLPQLPVLLMTAYGDVEKAVAAMHGGACDFLMKPFEPDVLLAHIARYIVVQDNNQQLIAEDPRSHECLSMAQRVAETDATVLLTGESGVGKEVYAQYIHVNSPRAAAPFVAINCAAIPENLLEATLFGHEKGAFTGAQSAQAGKFEQANHGTLLLDEISEMPLALQAKLLRVLQEREVERIGGKKSIPLDIRVLATSNRDMAQEVAQGQFREDLYYRLNVFPLNIPALRERPKDILPLAQHFLALHAQRLKRQATIDGEVGRILSQYVWPGNVRELENVMQRALILSPTDRISVSTIALCLPQQHGCQGGSYRQNLPAISAGNEDMTPRKEQITHDNPANMQDLEREHILNTLREVNGSRKKAVEKLGISERTLRYKLQKYREQGYAVN